jgi:hypothetical protein
LAGECTFYIILLSKTNHQSTKVIISKPDGKKLSGSVDGLPITKSPFIDGLDGLPFTN